MSQSARRNFLGPLVTVFVTGSPADDCAADSEFDVYFESRYWGQNSRGTANPNETAGYQNSLSYYCRVSLVPHPPFAESEIRSDQISYPLFFLWLPVPMFKFNPPSFLVSGDQLKQDNSTDTIPIAFLNDFFCESSEQLIRMFT